MTVLETYTHDQDGNMITRVTGGVTTQYRWNDKNRLVERKVAGVSSERQKYDAGGIRESKNDGTKYFSSGAVSVADLRPSSIPVSYFQGHQLLGMEVDGDFYYYVTDGLGSVRLVVDETGAVEGAFDHDAWGVPDTSVTPPGAELRAHTFVGGLGQRNEGGGLYYARQRWYDPGLGRWLSADPIGFSGGLNLYTYVGNNPINWADPSGLDKAYLGGFFPPKYRPDRSIVLRWKVKMLVVRPYSRLETMGCSDDNGAIIRVRVAAQQHHDSPWDDWNARDGQDFKDYPTGYMNKNRTALGEIGISPSQLWDASGEPLLYSLKVKMDLLDKNGKPITAIDEATGQPIPQKTEWKLFPTSLKRCGYEGRFGRWRMVGPDDDE